MCHHASPAEWLQCFRAKGWEWLLEQSDGDSIVAAYRYAMVLNASRGYVRPTPTLHEVRAAHRDVCFALGLTMPELSTVCNHLSRVGLQVV